MNTGTVDGLAAAIDLITTHPDLPAPYIASTTRGANASYYLMHEDTEADQKAEALRIIRAVGGKWDKHGNGDRLYFRQRRGTLTITIGVAREAVCERVVTGQERVERPAVESQPARVEMVDVVEWRCDPVLAGQNQ